MATILVVEDDVDVCNLIRSHLEAEGHQVLQAFDGPSALGLVAARRPDLVILDWMLPGLDGLSVCRRIRRDYLMPIIMLTARGEEIDRVVGLEVGADDYVVKPFGMRELLARVQAALRRVAMEGGPLPTPPATDPTAPSLARGVTTAPPEAEVVVHDSLRIDLAGRVVTVDGQDVSLSRREFDLLTLLATNPGRAFSRAYLIERLWSDDYEVVDRAVDTQVQRLRKKLGSAGGRIVTVWGVGYRFAA